MSLLQKIYPHLPVRFQNALVSGYGYFWHKRRYGGIFGEQLKLFKDREGFTVSQWRDYQNLALRKLLLHSFETVPHYNSAFKSVGLTKSQLEAFDIENINRLPILEKDTLRKCGMSSLLSVKRERNGAFFSSSGSTGTPVKILFSEAMHQRWRAAFEARIYNWAGLSRFNSRGMIGGRIVVPGGENARPPFYRYNSFEKQIYFSIYHIRKENAWSYRDAINRYKPDFMTGYATSNFLLASHFEDLKYEVQPLKAVITSSEKLTEPMRQVLANVYNCKVYDSWSGIEACGLISQHSDGNMYSSPDVAIIEILGDDLNPVRDGEVGGIYCTGLLNYDQPLIRYKIGDLARISTSVASVSPQMPVIAEIVGRIDDVVTLRDGRQLSSFNRFFADIPEIREVQVVQMSYESFVLNLVASSKYDSNIENELLNSIHTRLGKVKVDINRVDRIPRNSSGKFKAVVSHVKNKPGAAHA